MSQHRPLSFLAITFALAGCPADDGGSEESGADDEDSGSDTGTSMTGASMTAADDDSGTDASMTGADSTGGDPVDPLTCPGAGMGAGAAGEACTANADCESGICTLFTDAPVNEDAACGEPITTNEAGCNTRVTGTIFDFVTLMPIEGATMRAVGAVSAVSDPDGAAGIVTATSGADGRVDGTSELPIIQAIAVVALVDNEGSAITATGLAAPITANTNEPYPITNGIHDLWSVPSAELGMWSDALAMDEMVPADKLPLGEQGGVVGLVRDAAGLPIAGAVVAPVDAGSSAVIRYVNADNTVNADMTSELGIFVVTNSEQFGEDFEATVDGAAIGSGTAGTAPGVVFTVIITGD
jgi:hypothetical protein